MAFRSQRRRRAFPTRRSHAIRRKTVRVAGSRPKRRRNFGSRFRRNKIGASSSHRQVSFHRPFKTRGSKKLLTAQVTASGALKALAGQAHYPYNNQLYASIVTPQNSGTWINAFGQDYITESANGSEALPAFSLNDPLVLFDIFTSIITNVGALTFAGSPVTKFVTHSWKTVHRYVNQANTPVRLSFFKCWSRKDSGSRGFAIPAAGGATAEPSEAGPTQMLYNGYAQLAQSGAITADIMDLPEPIHLFQNNRFCKHYKIRGMGTRILQPGQEHRIETVVVKPYLHNVYDWFYNYPSFEVTDWTPGDIFNWASQLKPRRMVILCHVSGVVMEDAVTSTAGGIGPCKIGVYTTMDCKFVPVPWSQNVWSPIIPDGITTDAPKTMTYNDPLATVYTPLT